MNYPIKEEYIDALNAIKQKWRVAPFPAFDITDKPISSQELTVTLEGSLVVVHFELKHLPFSNKGSNAVIRNTFTATPTRIKVLKYVDEPPTSLTS
jgi:hypothetical protein